ncbi:g13188 [Coccomyxa viridis]|uniref:G13188 protein n=1 Tax=Coccomyxa viridis TaxID=1274662 RepID=A0ABP1GEV3_9CHLO
MVLLKTVPTAYGATFSQAWSTVPGQNFSGGTFKYSNITSFPGAPAMSATLINLTVGGIRGIHWHDEAEWAYVLSGTCRSVVMEEGRTHPAETWDYGEGDIWYFRPNEGHMVQGLAPSGCSYLAGYNNGSFSDPDSPSMAAWLDRLPVNIRMQGLGGPRLQQNSTNSANSVAGFITQGPMPAPSLEAFRASVRKPAQPAVTLTHRYQLSQQAPKSASEGGSITAADKENFPISEAMLGALIVLRPGGMRQLHWHTNEDEWQYVINGTILAGVFTAGGHHEENTLYAGDAGYAPMSSAHWFKNVGSTDSYVVLIFNAGQLTNLEATALVANMPAEVLAADLGITAESARALNPDIPSVAPPLNNTTS